MFTYIFKTKSIEAGTMAELTRYLSLRTKQNPSIARAIPGIVSAATCEILQMLYITVKVKSG